MSLSALLRLEALRKCNTTSNWVNADLYRLLYKTDLYIVAYEKIKSAPGNMTPGTDGVTLDGFSMDVIEDIVTTLRDEGFQFKPSRREHIPNDLLPDFRSTSNESSHQRKLEQEDNLL